METRLLRNSERELSPEASWLLLQWSRILGLSEPFACPRLELYRCLGMVHHQGRSALDELKKKGVVIDEPLRRRQGRPLSIYRVSPDFQNLLETLDAPIDTHRPEIESLCQLSINTRGSRKGQPGSLMRGEQRTNTLTPPTYWLLAVLLAHADTPGIVTGLSLRQLMTLTGMTKERLRSQLAKLNKLGIVDSNEPELQKKHRQVYTCSVYNLELSHPMLLGKDSTALTVPFISSKKPGEAHFLSGFYEAAVVATKLSKYNREVTERIKQKFSADEKESNISTRTEDLIGKNRCLNALWQYSTNAGSLVPYLQLSQAATDHFLELHELEMGPILKAHLQSYAITLLSNHWTDLKRGQGKPSKPISPVMKKIQWDYSILMPTNDKEGEQQSLQDFFIFLYSLAFSVAVQLQSCLRGLNEIAKLDLSTALFSINSCRSRKKEPWIIKAHFRHSNYVDQKRNLGYRPRSVSLSLPATLRALGTEITRELS